MRRLPGFVRILLQPRLVPLHLLGIAAVSAAVILGLWQYDAWQTRREEAARDLTSMPAVPLAELIDADEPFSSDSVGRPTRAEGLWLPDSTFYVSERQQDGAEGYWAVTALAVCDEGDTEQACASAPALLTVRGWTQDPATAPAPPTGRGSVSGWLQPPEGSGRVDDDPGDDVVPEVRIADAIQRVDQDLYGAFLVTREATPDQATTGLGPVEPTDVPGPEGSTGLRNLFYALEWWVFAAFALVIWWRWGKDEVERGSRQEVPSSP